MTDVSPAEAGPTTPATRRRFWSRFRIRPFRSWTLRSRVVLVVVAMLAVLGAVIGTISVVALQGYLMERLDGQLTSAVDRGKHAADRVLGLSPTNPLVAGIVETPGQPLATFGAVVSGENILYPQILSPRTSPADPTGSAAPRSVEANLTGLLTLPADGKPRTLNLGPALGDYRVAAAPLLNGDNVVIGLPLSEVTATVSQLTLVIVLVTLAGLIFAFLIATFVVRLAMRPLARVASTAQEVAELPLDRGDVALSVRVPEQDTDPHTEVGTVGAALNRMLGHIGSALSARQASEKKVRQFVADASHELRTPLASIRGYAELTRRGPDQLPPDVIRSIGRIESEATRMTSLVEDLLLLARLDEGRDLERDPVDLSILLVDAVSDAHAAGRDHTWSLDLPDEPVEILGDAARLHQVITNLLANARVHTPEGTRVTVSLSVDDDAGRAIIRVTDDGPGIPEGLESTLFERFARGDSSRARTTGSTGLGLAIVQAVVEAHGGDVSVQSTPGETTFTVSLPIGEQTAGAEVLASADEMVGAADEPVEADEVTAGAADVAVETSEDDLHQAGRVP